MREHGDRHDHRQPPLRPLLVFERAGPFQPVAGRQVDVGGSTLRSASATTESRSRSRTDSLMSVRRSFSSRSIRARPGLDLDSGQGAQGQALAVGAVDRNVADGLDVGDRLGRQLDDQVEGALAFEHLGGRLAADGGGDDGLDVGDRQAVARDGGAVDRDLDLRLAEQQVGADVGRARDGADESTIWSAYCCSFVGSSPNSLIASSLFTPETASSTLSSMYWLNWVSIPGISRRLRAMASQSASRSCGRRPLLPRLQADAVFGDVPAVDVGAVVGPADLADHIADLGEGGQLQAHVLGDLGRFRGRDGLRGEGAHPQVALVQLRQEFAAEEMVGQDPRQEEQPGHREDHAAGAQREVQRRPVEAQQPAHDPAIRSATAPLRKARLASTGTTRMANSVPTISAKVSVSAIGLKIRPSTRCSV